MEAFYKAQKIAGALQLDSEFRKELNLDHSSLEFLQEPSFQKTHQRILVSGIVLQPCSKKEDPVTLSDKRTGNDSNTLSRYLFLLLPAIAL
ncbi:hypothetical protein TNCV_3262521 [Trichonephila clavipes]|nr:hypothetical protein TNCV_3262521 [Trichonephila clavipes]